MRTYRLNSNLRTVTEYMYTARDPFVAARLFTVYAALTAERRLRACDAEFLRNLVRSANATRPQTDRGSERMSRH